MMTVRVVPQMDTLERLSRARDACRELLETFEAERSSPVGPAADRMDVQLRVQERWDE